MAVLLRLCSLLGQGVGGVAEQKVHPRCGLLQRSAGSRVPRKEEAQTLPSRAEDRFRRCSAAVGQYDALALLKRLPLLHRHPQRPGLLGRKAPGPGQIEAVALTRDPVAGGDRRQLCPLRPAAEALPERRRGVQHLGADRIGQRPGQHPQRGPDLAEAFRAVQRQRAGTTLTAQRLQKPRQAEDVVAVVVGQADGVQLHQVDPGPAGGGLGALAAVEQKAVPPAFGHCRRKCAVGQGHGGRRAQQCNGQHKSLRITKILIAIVYHTLRPGTIAHRRSSGHRMGQTRKGGVLYAASAARAACSIVPPSGASAPSGSSRGGPLSVLQLRSRSGVQPPGAAGVHPPRTGLGERIAPLKSLRNAGQPPCKTQGG